MSKHKHSVPRGFRQERRAALAAFCVGAAALAFQGKLLGQKAPSKTPAAPTKEELEAAYAETEKLVAKASTNDRPGIADWTQVQGQNLTWPAKYYLPWPAGIGHDVYQSWNGNKIGPPRATHMKAQNFYAWDFHIVRGDYICAARDGKVSNVSDQEPAGNENANVIYIDHADGERSVYAHIGSGTSLVAVGDKVLAGQKICQGSNESMHLHFVIWKGMVDFPCRFIDYTPYNGVPQYGSVIVSGNKEPDAAITDEIKNNYRKGNAAFEAKDYLNALKFFLAATLVEVRIEEYERSLERIEECRQIIDTEVGEAIANAKNGDFAGAEKRFKEIKKKYGDYAKGRIDAGLAELKSDPKFKDWIQKQQSERIWLEARKAEKYEKWDDAIKAYEDLKRIYKKGDPEYEEVRKKLTKLRTAKAIEE